MTFAPIRVLLVEDEALLVMQLELFLAEAGHTLAGSANSGKEAIATSSELRADVALIDTFLADGPTGIEVARHIAEHTAMIPVFLTANAARIPKDFAGAVGVIAKPYTRAGLLAALDYVVRCKRTLDPAHPVPRSLTLRPENPGADFASATT